MPKGGEP